MSEGPQSPLPISSQAPNAARPTPFVGKSHGGLAKLGADCYDSKDESDDGDASDQTDDPASPTIQLSDPSGDWIQRQGENKNQQERKQNQGKPGIRQNQGVQSSGQNYVD